MKSTNQTNNNYSTNQTGNARVAYQIFIPKNHFELCRDLSNAVNKREELITESSKITDENEKIRNTNLIEALTKAIEARTNISSILDRPNNFYLKTTNRIYRIYDKKYNTLSNIINRLTAGDKNINLEEINRKISAVTIISNAVTNLMKAYNINDSFIKQAKKLELLLREKSQTSNIGSDFFKNYNDLTIFLMHGKKEAKRLSKSEYNLIKTLHTTDSTHLYYTNKVKENISNTLEEQNRAEHEQSLMLEMGDWYLGLREFNYEKKLQNMLNRAYDYYCDTFENTVDNNELASRKLLLDNYLNAISARIDDIRSFGNTSSLGNNSSSTETESIHSTGVNSTSGQSNSSKNTGSITTDCHTSIQTSPDNAIHDKRDLPTNTGGEATDVLESKKISKDNIIPENNDLTTYTKRSSTDCTNNNQSMTPPSQRTRCCCGCPIM